MTGNTIRRIEYSIGDRSYVYQLGQSVDDGKISAIDENPDNCYTIKVKTPRGIYRWKKITIPVVCEFDLNY